MEYFKNKNNCPDGLEDIIAANFYLPDISLVPINKGYGEEKYVVLSEGQPAAVAKIYGYAEAETNSMVKLMEWVSGEIRIPYMLKAKHDGFFVPIGDKNLILYEHIAGNDWNEAACTMDTAYYWGWLLGSVHKKLEEFPYKAFEDETPTAAQRMEAMKKKLDEVKAVQDISEYNRVIQKKLEYLQGIKNEIIYDRDVIHGDFCPFNFIFDNDGKAIVLDWRPPRRFSGAWELTRLLFFLEGNWEKPTIDSMNIWKKCIKGYASIRAIDEEWLTNGLILMCAFLAGSLYGIDSKNLKIDEKRRSRLNEFFFKRHEMMLWLDENIETVVNELCSQL